MTTTAAKAVEPANPLLKPINNNFPTLQLKETSDPVKRDTADTPKTDTPKSDPAAIKPVESVPPAAEPPAQSMKLRLGTDLPEMKTGDKMKVPVIVDGTGKFRSAVMGLNFDPARVAVRSVSFGDVFGSTAVNTAATPFLNQNGKMYITLQSQGRCRCSSHWHTRVCRDRSTAAGPSGHNVRPRCA